MIFPVCGGRRDDWLAVLGLMKPAAFSLAQFEVEGYGAFVAAAGLKLHRIALIQILELHARRKAAAMEKDVVAAVVGNDETKALISDNFFNRSGHIGLPSGSQA
jgi:hypothetical protein